MSMREPYDQERVVRTSEIHEQPTESIRSVDAGRRADPADAVDVDERVVREDVVVRQPVTNVDYTDSAVSENLEIDHVVARRALLDRISSLLWFVVGLIEVGIGLRLAFKLLEADAANGFVNFIYNVTEPFVRPFQGIFTDPTSDGAVLDSSALLAMIIWAIVAWAAIRLIWLLFDRSESGVRRSVRETRHDHA